MFFPTFTYTYIDKGAGGWIDISDSLLNCVSIEIYAVGHESTLSFAFSKVMCSQTMRRPAIKIFLYQIVGGWGDVCAMMRENIL